MNPLAISCFTYPLAFKRVNKKRPEVPEDLLIPGDILSYANELGLSAKSDLCLSVVSRGPIATIYYFFMNKFPFLAKVLPCTRNFVFQKTKS